MAITNVTEALEALKDLANNLPEAGNGIPYINLAEWGIELSEDAGNIYTANIIPTNEQLEAYEEAVNYGIARFYFNDNYLYDTVVTMPAIVPNGGRKRFIGRTNGINIIEIYYDEINQRLRVQLHDSHSHSANNITYGTFNGQVVAESSTQAPATMLLRNSKLVTTETNPTNNGEIVWQYG